MTPAAYLDTAVDPALVLLRDVAGITKTNSARVMLAAIAGQESRWETRFQATGPARGYLQFEPGGLSGVMTHPASRLKFRQVCQVLDVPWDGVAIFEAIAWHDVLAAALGRLLLFTDAAPLPVVGDVTGAWDYYKRLWRPGKPRYETWPAVYQVAAALV